MVNRTSARTSVADDALGPTVHPADADARPVRAPAGGLDLVLRTKCAGAAISRGWSGSSSAQFRNEDRNPYSAAPIPRLLSSRDIAVLECQWMAGNREQVSAHREHVGTSASTHRPRLRKGFQRAMAEQEPAARLPGPRASADRPQALSRKSPVRMCSGYSRRTISGTGGLPQRGGCSNGSRWCSSARRRRDTGATLRWSDPRRAPGQRATRPSISAQSVGASAHGHAIPQGAGSAMERNHGRRMDAQ